MQLGVSDIRISLDCMGTALKEHTGIVTCVIASRYLINTYLSNVELLFSVSLLNHAGC